MSAANQYWFRGNAWSDPGTGEPCFWRTHRASEHCGGCHKHIRHHFGHLEYRCYSREADGAPPLTSWPETQGPTAIAEGTAPGSYAPMPGDIVDVDCRGLRPTLGAYGTRLATVERPTQAHGCDLAWVRLPGYEKLELVDADALTLVYRRKPEQGP